MSDLVVAKVEATGDDEEPGEGGAKTPPKLTDLPEELLLYLATFLNGRDVVHLSHVNQVRALLRIWVKCCLTWIVSTIQAPMARLLMLVFVFVSNHR